MKQLLKNIFTILSGREKRKFTRLILLDILVSILDIGFLLLLVFVVGFYTKTYSGEHIPQNIRSLMDRYPLLLISVFLVLFTLKNLFGFFLYRTQFRFVYTVASRLSKDNLTGYLDGSFSDYANIDSSIHFRNISHGPIEFSHNVLRGVQQVISQVVLIMVTLVPIVFFNPLLFALLFALLLPPVILTARVTRKRLASLRQAGKKNRERSIQYLKEALSGYIESNIYHRKDFFIERFDFLQRRSNDEQSEYQVMQSLPSRLIEVFAVFGLFLLVIFQVYASGGRTVPILLIGGFMAAAYKIIPGIVRILNSVESIKIYSFTVNDLLKEKKQNTPVAIQNNLPIHSVVFSHTRFSYKDDIVLSDFTMTLKPGEFVGLSGVSGKGKTTIINLLLGFVEPDSGSVTINDSITVAKERQAYWSRISYIKQQSFFIHDSVRKNITLHETFEKERLAKVMQLTGVDRLVAEQPQGIDTVLSENGRNISGGQRQRIILARALYKDADLIILDEPFSELDRVSEDRLLNHFRELVVDYFALFLTASSEI